MQIIDLLRKRRSIRKFTTQPVPDEKIELLKEAVLRSPSSKNRNSWNFIFVDDPHLIKELAECKAHGTLPLDTATLAVVICADESQNDVWIEDSSIAAIILQLSAQSIGLGSCWIQIRNRDHSDGQTSEAYLQQLLGIPSHFRVLSIVATGYPATEREGKSFNELQFEKIKLNRF